MKKKFWTTTYNIFSSFVIYNFVLLCFLGYLLSKNMVLSFVLMIATVLWFYSLLIELLHLFGFLHDKE